ncbi:enoyl-CoA hydratase-related protein [soil metagenome]
MTATAQASIEEADGILTVTLTRDEKLNAITPEMTAVLWEAHDAVATRDDLRALVITARGRFFTAGIDLAAESPSDAPTGSEFRRRYREHHALYDAFEALEKPVVLAAQGPCLGAGVEMAGSCDFRFAAEGTWFQLPEVTIGTVAGSGGISRINRIIGPAWTKWMAMAARKVDAERALAIGLVHEVYPVEGFQQRVHDVVREIVALPVQALGASKLVIDMTTEVDRATARDIERLANTSLIFGAEYTEARAAFNAKSAAKNAPGS